jgi:pyridoxal phosphate-dependent aminotransferase EpsN
MSNVLTCIGRRPEVLNPRVEQRRAIAFRYPDAFADPPGISLKPQAPCGVSTSWRSCFLIDGGKFGCSRDTLTHQSDAANIESRPVWKPMHLQRLFTGCECHRGAAAAELHHSGICLPGSSSLSAEDQIRIIDCGRPSQGVP